MSNAVLTKFVAERDEVIAQAEGLMQRDDFDPTTDEAYQALKTRADSLNKTIADLGEFQATKSAADALDATLSRSSRKVEQVKERSEEPASFGEVFTRSDEFAEYRGRGTMSPVELEGFLTRAVHETSDFWLTSTQRYPDDRPFSTPIQDSATIVPVSTNSVDVVTYQFTNAAAVVAEAGDKPESGLAQTITSITLDTVAHWVQFTRQLYADAPAVAARVDNSLRRGILKKLEAEAEDVITGGTYGAVASSGDLMGGIRKAIGELQDEYDPSHVYLNPADWADLDIAVQGQQTLGAVGVLQRSYWGMTIVPSSDVAAGTALVADAGIAFEVYRREAVQTFLTDSHASTFIANVLTLLAEARQKTVVVDPAAVRQVTTA